MGKRGNGEGSIYYSKKLNRWVGQYTFGNKRKSLYGKTRKEVKDKLIIKLNEIQQNILLDRCDYTVYDLGKHILDMKLASNSIQGKTYVTISNSLNKIKNSDIGNINIKKINYALVQDFLNTLTDLSNAYIQKIIIMLNQLFCLYF